jgi:hypothetical protein
MNPLKEDWVKAQEVVSRYGNGFNSREEFKVQ